MTNPHHRRARRHGVLALGIVALALIGGVLVTWSWNTLATDLFEAPRMAFRHALAAEMLIGVLAAAAAIPFRLARAARLQRGAGASTSP